MFKLHIGWDSHHFSFSLSFDDYLTFLLFFLSDYIGDRSTHIHTQTLILIKMIFVLRLKIKKLGYEITYWCCIWQVSGLMLASHTSIRHLFSKTLSQYEKLRKKQAFIDAYRKFPMFAVSVIVSYGYLISICICYILLWPVASSCNTCHFM